MAYSIGEKPGIGTYQCTSCNSWTAKLNDSTDTLPPCGKCGKGQHVTYIKIG